MARKKVVIASQEMHSWEECDRALGEIAIAKAHIESEESRYNEAEHKRRSVLVANHAHLKERILELEQGLKNFCTTHRKDFGERKSLELTHGTVSFRKGTPKVDKVKSFTWEAIADLCKSAPKKLRAILVRERIEIDKESILRAFAARQEDERGQEGLGEEDLAPYRMYVVQEESFGYDIKDAAGGNE